MKKILAALTLLLVLCAGAAADEPKSEPEAPKTIKALVFNKALLRVYALHMDGAMSAGTAFLTEDGVFTAFHVVDGPIVLVKVVTWDGGVYDVSKWTRVFREDIARLEVELPERLPRLKMADEGLTECERGTVMGYWGESIGLGTQVMAMGVLLPGVPVSPYFLVGGTTYYTGTILALPGLSGSPVLVGDKVVGVMSGISGGVTVYARLDKAHLVARTAAQVAEAARKAAEMAGASPEGETGAGGPPDGSGSLPAPQKAPPPERHLPQPLVPRVVR